MAFMFKQKQQMEEAVEHFVVEAVAWTSEVEEEVSLPFAEVVVACSGANLVGGDPSP